MFDIITIQTDVRQGVGENKMKDNERTGKRILERSKMRRRHERQKAIFRFAAAMFIVMTIASFTLSIRSFASEKDNDKARYKYYTSYSVAKGENLSILANRYMTDDYRTADDYISEVVSINHLVSASDIYAGQVLILPYYSTDIK